MLKYTIASNTWSRVAGNNKNGVPGPGAACDLGPVLEGSPMMRHSLVKKVTIFGGGGEDGIGRVWKITDAGVITPLTRPSFYIDTGCDNRSVTADPVTGNFLWIRGGGVPANCANAPGGNGQLWELNPDGAGTWTLIDADLGASGKICNQKRSGNSACSNNFVGTSISTYGVTMFYKDVSPTAAEVWVYKHEDWVKQPAKDWATRAFAPGVLMKYGFDSDAEVPI